MGVRRKLGRNEGYVYIDKLVLEHLYITKRLSQRQIAEVFSVSHTIIYLRLKEYGIQARPPRYVKPFNKSKKD